MRKTRVFAALLCVMMVATAIPMMQAGAATTYAEADLLSGFEAGSSITFADYAKSSAADLDDLAKVPGILLDGVAKDYVSSNMGPHVSSVLTATAKGGYVASVNTWDEANSKWVSSNPGNRTQVWLLSAEKNLQLSAGNYWQYGSTAVPVSPYYDYGQIKTTGYIGSGATKIEIALVDDASSGTIDYNKSITTDDITFDKDGFTIGGTSYPYPLTAGTYYTLLVKAEGDNKVLYVKADGAAAYDKVATYNTDLIVQELCIYANYPDYVDAKVYSTASSGYNTDGTDCDWLPATAAQPDATNVAVADLKAYTTMSSISVKSIRAYQKADLALNQVLDGAVENSSVDFSTYHMPSGSSNYTPADGPMKDVTLAPHTGADLYKVYEAAGGYSINTDQINAANVNKGPFFRALIYDENKGYQLDGDSRWTNMAVTSEGLAFRLGNKAASVPGNTGIQAGACNGVNGWEWNDSASDEKAYYRQKEGGLNINMGYTGAIGMTVKFNYAKSSRIQVLLADGVNGDDLSAASGFLVGTQGISVENGADTITHNAFPIDEGTWYDIVLKNNYNHYTIYARKSGDDEFTKVVSYGVKKVTTVSENQKLYIRTWWGDAPDIPTKIVTFNVNGSTDYKYENGNLGQYKATDVPADLKAGDTFKGKTVVSVTDGATIKPMGETVISNITTYKDKENLGVTLDSIVGPNAVALSSYVNDAATKAILKANGTSFASYGGYTGGNAGVNADGDVYLSHKDGTRSYVGLHSLPAFTPDKAVELSVTIPLDSTVELNLRGKIDDTNRVYANLGGKDTPGLFFIGTDSGNYAFNNSRGVTESATSIERTYLFTYETETEGATPVTYAKAWVKMPSSDKYLYLGAFGMKSGSTTYGFRLEQAGTGTTDYIINKLVVYDKDDAVQETATLPEDAEDMYQFVNQGFNEKPDANKYKLFRTGPEDRRGHDEYVDGKMKIVVPTKGEGDSLYTFITTPNIYIPVGGYAETSIKSDYRQPFSIMSRDGSSAMSITIKPGVNGISYNQTPITTNLNIEPGLWVDLKILRDAEGDYTLYVKKEGGKWVKAFENVAPTANSSAPLMQIGGYDFAGSNRETDAAYMEYLNIYGPKGDGIFLVDGEGTTAIVKNGDVLNFANDLQISFLPAEENDAKLIFAYYDADGILLSADLETDVTADADQNEISLTKDLSVLPPNTATIKIFLWEADNLTTPVYKARTITVPVAAN